MNPKNSNLLIMEGLENNSVADFQLGFEKKLNETFKRKTMIYEMNLLKEEDENDDDEIEFFSVDDSTSNDSDDTQTNDDTDANAAVVKIETASKSFGGEPIDNVNGVVLVKFRTKQGCLDFADYLEDQEEVEYYEMWAEFKNRFTSSTEEVDEVDFDNIFDDAPYDFYVMVYLYPEYVQFVNDIDGDGDDDLSQIFDNNSGANDDEEEFIGGDDETEEEEINEAIRKIRINSRGQKRVKMKCLRGFIWNPQTNTCEKITGQQLAVMRKAIRKALITKHSKGAALKVRFARKIRKAFKFRRIMGLKV